MTTDTITPDRARRTATGCSFAFPGTYGHECGKPAVVVGLTPSKLTVTGIYYARRCENCRRIKGGENTGITKWEPINPAKHVNAWR